MLLGISGAHLFLRLSEYSVSIRVKSFFVIGDTNRYVPGATWAQYNSSQVKKKIIGNNLSEDGRTDRHAFLNNDVDIPTNSTSYKM